PFSARPRRRSGGISTCGPRPPSTPGGGTTRSSARGRHGSVARRTGGSSDHADHLPPSVLHHPRDGRRDALLRDGATPGGRGPRGAHGDDVARADGEHEVVPHGGGRNPGALAAAPLLEPYEPRTAGRGVPPVR